MISFCIKLLPPLLTSVSEPADAMKEALKEAHGNRMMPGQRGTLGNEVTAVLFITI